MDGDREMEITTIITKDGAIHAAYEGPYPWSDGALAKAEAGSDGYSIVTGAVRAEYLEGDAISDWDTTTGTFNGTRPVYEPTEAEKLNSEKSELLSYLSSTDWYAIRLADEGTAIPNDIKTARSSARTRISEINTEPPNITSE